MLFPIVMVAAAVLLQLLFLLLAPLALVPVLRRGVQRVQYVLVASVGDSMAFVAVPESFEQMVRRVREDLARLDSLARRIIVVAHSQGAAVAHEALHAVEEKPWRLDPTVVGVTSVAVQNQKSVLTDHTTYQCNTEQVLVPLIDRIWLCISW
ncbi:hypothetical protein [Streptomyces fulvoviolaceus]|uniref:hypothetical protein n=1 Tax=Streptomyces fulvoviolaceus TaxID=285535 RepID=UPI0021BF04A8|nr:hypothetical protein [Streptomyces fulvoviolaceus]MCT9081321.1 hypothetical protein [Streptomyces fulvoviolaceus]